MAPLPFPEVGFDVARLGTGNVFERFVVDRGHGLTREWFAVLIGDANLHLALLPWLVLLLRRLNRDREHALFGGDGDLALHGVNAPIGDGEAFNIQIGNIALGDVECMHLAFALQADH